VRSPVSLLTLPAVCFAELKLGELADNPEYGSVGDLPYANIDHLRQCLVDLRTKTVHTKMVDRISPPAFPYRTLKTGLYIGNQGRLMCFPMPSPEVLRAHSHLRLTAFSPNVWVTRFLRVGPHTGPCTQWV